MNGVAPVHIVTIMCCHEAAHAVAAYRQRLPYRYVRVTLPVGGVVTETDLGPDVEGMDIARRYLESQGADLSYYWGGYLSVLAIAKFVNQHHNNLPEAVAAGFASNDFEVYNARLSSFPPAFQGLVNARVNEQINDIWGHARFAEALEAVANALLHRRYLTPGEVAAVIESRIGTDMRPATPDPTEDQIRGSAFLRYTRRAEAGDDGTHSQDWYEAERGLQFALTCQH